MVTTSLFFFFITQIGLGRLYLCFYILKYSCHLFLEHKTNIFLGHGRKFTHKQSHKMFTQSVDPRMSLQIVTVFLVKIVTNKFLYYYYKNDHSYDWFLQNETNWRKFKYRLTKKYIFTSRNNNPNAIEYVIYMHLWYLYPGSIKFKPPPPSLSIDCPVCTKQQ